ncbi:MAG TPA: hypothetical protein VFL93_11880 [Longimicrobiaceae bacterium]|nr:hypothetical protein [Longimicrobiaceae bacterium]
MNLAHRFLHRYPNRLEAYLALECTLMRRYLVRGGTPDDFVRRFGRAFHRHFAWMVE